MSTDYDLVCKDCGKGVDTLASTSIAYGEKLWANPENLDKLRAFLFAHVDHHLVFVNEYSPDALGEDDRAAVDGCEHERLNDHGDACLGCGAVYIDGKWQ